MASVDVMEFQTTDAYSSLDRTSAMYSLSILVDSIEEKLKVILRISPKRSEVYYQYTRPGFNRMEIMIMMFVYNV
jgi:hypothetical protein